MAVKSFSSCSQTLHDMSGNIWGARVEDLSAIGDPGQVHGELVDGMVFHLVSVECRDTTVRILHGPQPALAAFDLFGIAIAEL